VSISLEPRQAIVPAFGRRRNNAGSAIGTPGAAAGIAPSPSRPGGDRGGSAAQLLPTRRRWPADIDQ
jgi:hypothetical protein